MRTFLALLFFLAFAIHVVFLVRALKARDYAGWRLRIVRLVVSFCQATGLAGIILLPDGWLAWLAVATVLTCCIAEVAFAFSDRAASAHVATEHSLRTRNCPP